VTVRCVDTGRDDPKCDIGREASEVRDHLTTILADLHDAAGSAFSGALSDARGKLSRRPVRIGFAGLSGALTRPLIGGLTGHSDLLPVDRSGLAAPVVSLVFGDPEGRESGLDFHLFDDSAFAQIARSAGRLRRASESPASAGLVGRISHELRGMREAAERIHGARLDQLLGARHRIDRSNASVAARYLRAHRVDDPAPSDGDSSYAPLTRSASIFVPAGRFCLPVELIDTPGIVPDRQVPEEITLSVLEHVDAAVLVYDATRELTQLDEAALRHLAAHGPAQILVVVDRIDEVVDPDVALNDRRRQIQACLPGRDVSVIGCSARLAARATLIQRAQGFETDGLIERSGLPLLAKCIGEIIFWGPANDAATAVIEDLEAIATRASEALERQAGGAQRGAGATAPTPVTGKADPKALAELSEAAEQAKTALEATVDRLWSFVYPPVVRGLGQLVQAEAEAIHDRIDKNEEAIGHISLEPIAADVLGMLTIEIDDAAERLGRELERLAESFGAVLARHRPGVVPARPDLSPMENLALPPGKLDCARGLTLDHSRRALMMKGYFRRADRVAAVAQRLAQLMMPGTTRAVEESTLALGQAARQSLEILIRDAKARLATPAQPVAIVEDAHAADLAMRAAACGEIAEQLRRYRSALEAGKPKRTHIVTGPRAQVTAQGTAQRTAQGTAQRAAQAPLALTLRRPAAPRG